MRADLHEDDWQLFSRAAHDDNAMAIIFERHRDFVFRVAWGVLNEEAEAEDVTQDVFMLIQARKLRAEPKAKFTTWLFKVVINSARARARKRRRVWGHNDPIRMLFGNEDCLRDPERFDNLSDLARALSHLPLRQREVVVLRFLEGFNTSETAMILGCREGTVKAHLSRATQSLRRKLTQQPGKGEV